MNDVAVIGGTTTGVVTEDAAAMLETSGTLTVADADTGEAVFIAQASAAGTYGTFTLSTAGAWTYAADNTQAAIQELGAADELTDSFTAVTADGTEQVVTVKITGVNDIAVIGGDATGSVTEDAAATLEASGTLTILDVDYGEAEFLALTRNALTWETTTVPERLENTSESVRLFEVYSVSTGHRFWVTSDMLPHSDYIDYDGPDLGSTRDTFRVHADGKLEIINSNLAPQLYNIVNVFDEYVTTIDDVNYHPKVNYYDPGFSGDEVVERLNNVFGCADVAA
ncbi:hypothetical protein C6W91_21050 [Phaeobacter sp. SYSU ZJ3003]